MAGASRKLDLIQNDMHSRRAALRKALVAIYLLPGVDVKIGYDLTILL